MNRAQRRMAGKQARSTAQGTQDDIDALIEEAARHYSAGKFDKAEKTYLSIVALKPDWAEAQANLGAILQQQGKLAEATRRYQIALKLLPESAAVHYNLANVFKELGQVGEAIAHYKKTLAFNPDYAEAYNNLGITYKQLEKLHEAATQYRHALRLNPTYAEAHNNLGNALKEQGEFEEARTHYERALGLNPDYAEAYYNYADLVTFRSEDTVLGMLKTLGERIEQLPAAKRLYVHFALAKALDDSGDYDGAFEHMAKGNALKRRGIRYDEARIKKTFRKTAATFTTELFEHFHGSGSPSSVPIFIVGMPRSGTTLIEQILASHPQIHGAGELSILDNLARNISGYPTDIINLNASDLQRLGELYLTNLPPLPSGKDFITDKRPLNFQHIGLIRLILPNARIIHVSRTPADTCLSCFSKLFAADISFSHSLAELGHYYRQYDMLMDHWRTVLPQGCMLEVHYEDIVQYPQTQTRRLLDYCGLPWDDECCLKFYETRRNITTASTVQVRQPLFKHALNRWQHYRKFLQPLLDKLPDTAKDS